MKVLIADDSPTMRRLLQSTLEEWGYEVVEAQDGEQALDILCGEDPPTLAILKHTNPCGVGQGADGSGVDPVALEVAAPHGTGGQQQADQDGAPTAEARHQNKNGT